MSLRGPGSAGVAPASFVTRGTARATGDVATSTSTSTSAAASVITPTAQTPTCAVPRLDPAKQVMQPSPAQVDWAAQMAEQGLLTGTAYTRPAGLRQHGPGRVRAEHRLPADRARPPVRRHLGHGAAVGVSRRSWRRSRTGRQASWHALPGVAGDPLIADYYGAGGGIDSINYAGADCGYGISQVTTGMAAGDTTFSAHGQIKVAVDYQENIAAGLQILETTWNQLYADGITVNGGDPQLPGELVLRGLGVQLRHRADRGDGNTTGCTPGPSCTGPDGTWGLGWANNPAQPRLPAEPRPVPEATYADAATPGDWPYQERVMGWMGSPIIRYRRQPRRTPSPTYNGGKTWLQIPPFASFCTVAGNNCDPTAINPRTRARALPAQRLRVLVARAGHLDHELLDHLRDQRLRRARPARPSRRVP